MSWIWMMWIYSYGKMGNQTVQLVVQHCCKMSSKATFLVLLNTFKPNQVVASCVNTDFGLDKITGESRHSRDLRQLLKNKIVGPVKRATCTDFVAKRRTTPFFPSFRNLQQPDLLQDSLIRGWLMRNAAGCSTLFEAMLQKEMHVFVARFVVS